MTWRAHAEQHHASAQAPRAADRAGIALRTWGLWAFWTACGFVSGVMAAKAGGW